MTTTATKRKRPRDPIQLAKLIGDIATRQVIEVGIGDDREPTNGRPGGLVGGKRRAVILAPERRKEIAKKAAQARWSPPSKAKVEAEDS